MRLTAQKENSHWREKYIVDSIKINTVPRKGDYITLKRETYEVIQVTIDYDNDEWIHLILR